MEERNITVTLEQAKKWLNSGNLTLKGLALQAFSEDELKNDFMKITTFKDACEALDLGYNTASSVAKALAKVSRASSAMFKLNIIRKALNLGCNLSLTKDPKSSCVYYPHNPFMAKGSTYYKDTLRLGRMETIGVIKSDGIAYEVLGGDVYNCGRAGLGYFCSADGAGGADASVGFLGCASKKIARHFGKYFGMLITEAKYGDMVDFEIIKDKYGNTK